MIAHRALADDVADFYAILFVVGATGDARCDLTIRPLAKDIGTYGAWL
jgi:hypothetical protein